MADQEVLHVLQNQCLRWHEPTSLNFSVHSHAAYPNALPAQLVN